MRRARNQSAFTLIELMVVLIVIGIFSGLMLAEMRGTYEDALLRSTARTIISAANLASSRAVTVNSPHALQIDATAARLRIYPAGRNGEGEEEKIDSRISVVVRDFIPWSDEESEPGTPQEGPLTPDTIQFFADGTASPREILLRDRLGVELILRINPVTGRIRPLESESDR